MNGGRGRESPDGRPRRTRDVRCSMIIVKINGEQRAFAEVDDTWFTQRIERPQAAGALVCVQVSFDDADVHMQLQTPTCASGGGGGRQANPHEMEIFAMWARWGLNSHNFTAARVMGFLKEASRSVRAAA